MQKKSLKKRVQEYGIKIGVLPSGKNNAITDVKDVLVGQVTLNEGDGIRTGVTAIVPHTENIFMNKVPAACYVGNGFGKFTGSTQIDELGNLETPIVLTNTMSIAAGFDGIIDYTLSFPENDVVRSINAVVGETNDSNLNDIRARKVTRGDVLKAIKEAKNGAVDEGCVGAGTGTTAFGFKGGIGTASRVIPKSLGGYTVGVLVQSNFGGVLEVNGAPVGVELKQFLFREAIESADGSIVMVVATDAPVDSRNLKRLAKRAMIGLGKTGSIVSNGSGDYVVAFSTHKESRVSHIKKELTDTVTFLRNDNMSPLFMAVIEATEEAILNSLFMATTTTGVNGKTVHELPMGETLEILKKYGKIKKN